MPKSNKQALQSKSTTDLELTTAPKTRPPYVQSAVRIWCRAFKKKFGLVEEMPDAAEQDLAALGSKLSEADRAMLLAVIDEIRKKTLSIINSK
jgi:hypothetical protein